MPWQLPADYESAPLYYIPIRAPILPYIQGALEQLQDESLWLDDAAYSAAYQAIAELRIAMATFGTAGANEILAGPAAGAAGALAVRRLVVADLPALSYALLTDLPATWPPENHAAQHATAGGDPISPLSIGAAAAGHVHSYSTLTGTPSSFTPAAHATNHAAGGSDVLTPSAIGAALASHTHAYSALTSIPSTFAPAAHATSHSAIGTDPITPAAIGAAAASHSHSVDWSVITNKPATIHVFNTAVTGNNWNNAAKAAGTYTINVLSEFSVPSNAIAIYLRIAATWASAGASLNVRANTTSTGVIALVSQVANGRVEATGICGVLNGAIDLQIFTAATTLTYINCSAYWL